MFVGDLDAFVGKFSPAGAHLWSLRFGDGSGQYVQGLATDAAGNVYITGGGPLSSDGSGDVFLVKLAPSGTHVWSQRFGDFQDQSGLGVAGSATGRVGVTGRFQGGINLGDGPKTSQGQSDLFVGVFGP
nr:SBBP repeat-containing protein [Nannocystis sp. SCPEA4]